MESTNRLFRKTALATALAFAFAPAFADDAEIARLSQPDSYLSLGLGSWSQDRFQQGIYDGMRESGIYGLFDAQILRRDEASGTWTSVRADRLGLDNRSIQVEVGKQGSMGATVGYRRIQRDHPLVIESGLQGIGTPDLTISGSGADALPKRKVTLGTARDRYNLGLYKNLMPGLDFKFAFTSEQKKGTRHWGLGSDALFLAEPIDSSTHQVDLTLEFTGEKLQMQGGYSGSWFDNNNDLVLATVNGADQPGSVSRPNPTPLTLPLDNHAHQFFVHAGYSITPDTRATVKLSRTVAVQNDTLPTISLAAPNDPFVGAPSSLHGELVTSLVEVGVSSQPIPKLSLSGNLRYYDLDDQTPLAGFVGNNTTGDPTVHNTPHSFTTKSGKLEASYRLPARFRLTGGVDVKNQDRSFPQFEGERFVPFRAEVDETTYRLQLRRSMSATVNGSIAFLHSKRDGSHYELTEAEQSDLINPLHIADRERDKWRASVDWAPTNGFGLQLVVEDSQDDYDSSPERPYGLQDGSARLVSLDAHYAITDEWQLSGWLAHDETKAKQFNGRWDRITETHELDRESRLRDKGDSVGFGVRGAVGEKLNLGADLQWTRSRSSYDQEVALTGATVGSQDVYPTSGGVTAVDLPDIENKLTRISLFAKYELRSNSELRVDLIHERWETDDWSWTIADGTAFVYGSTTDGTTVSVKPKQTSSFVGVRYIYRFQ